MPKFTIYEGPVATTPNDEKVDAVWVHDTDRHIDVSWWLSGRRIDQRLFGFHSSLPNDNMSREEAVAAVEELVETVLSWEGWAEKPRTPRADPPGRWYPCFLKDGAGTPWMRRYLSTAFARQAGDGRVTLFSRQTKAWTHMTLDEARTAFTLNNSPCAEQVAISREFEWELHR